MAKHVIDYEKERERAKKRSEALHKFLDEMRVNDPEKYKALEDAEKAMFQSFLDHR